MNFSSNSVLEARKRMKLTQKELGEHLGVAPNYVYMLEKGIKPITREMEVRLNELERTLTKTSQPRQGEDTATREVRRLTLADLPGDPEDYILADVASLIGSVSALGTDAQKRLATILAGAAFAANPTVGQDTRLWNATEALRILRRLFEEDLGLDLPKK